MPFLRTPESHRWQAELLRKAGNERLAKQHDLMAATIEAREAQEFVRREFERVREERRRARSARRS
jgi:hypothetical protein